MAIGADSLALEDGIGRLAQTVTFFFWSRGGPTLAIAILRHINLH